LFQDDPRVQVGTLKPSTVRLLDPNVNVETLTRRNYVGQLSNVDVIQESALGQGFFNSAPDSDGYIRRALTVVEHKGELYSSLSLEMARLYNLSEQIEIETEFIPALNWHSMTAVRFGQTRIPTDAYGRVLVPYRGGQKSFPYYSATDILHGRIAPELLENGLALVGTSAVGLADLRATPVGVQYPGVEVHANVLEGILQAAKRAAPGQEQEVTELFSFRPDWWSQALFVQVLLLGLILTLWLPFLGPVQMALVGGISAAMVVGFNLYLWQVQKIELPLLQPLVLVMLITTYNMVRGFFKENSSRQQIKSMFDQYVPPAHIDQMLDDPESVNLEGERKEMSVLFSDIRSFTSISERLSANDLKDMLNEYFSPITKSIFEHQGTIDKYVGDMVMAFWGAPLDDPNHAEHAVIGGFDMLRITAELRAVFAAKGWPEIYVGIGINTGEMNVGDMGSEYRRAYTVLGDAVNLGSRLEGLTKFYGVEFLVSETTKAQCTNIEFRPIDRVKVKGKDVAVAIFEPICKKGELSEQENDELQLLLDAYDAYLEQRWLDAQVLYTKLQQQNPNRKLYQVYLERIELLREQDLGSDWDGSYTHTSK
jgi:adenylate cyclase